jgi:CBS domain-containing protein
MFPQEFSTMTIKTVADVMTRTLVTVAPDCTVPQLEKVLTDHRIGAVPVLDHGKLGGIVSRADVMRRICVERSVAEVVSAADIDFSGFDQNPSAAVEFTEIAELLGCRIDHLTAADVMSTEIRSVTPDAPLAAAAKLMIAHRLHHVLVLEGDALVGLLSSFDIVRHVADGGDTG